MMATGAAHYDLSRFGMEIFRASPRQADLMIVAGRVSQKMAPVLRQVYDQMVEPKWVISMGVCASSGGMFNNYAIVQGVDQVVPVDVYTPGCPPGPETLMHSILTLHERITVGVTPQRFEVVVSLLDMQEGKRVRVRAQVPEREPTLPTLFELFPGTEAMEREVYDMFGIVFEGHPDLTRILMPDDWEGHPLRKDYPIGRIPVQFKEAPGPR